MLNMWVSTNKKLDNSTIFFRFRQNKDYYIFNFTNMKNFYAKEICKSSFTSIYAPNKYPVEVETENVIEYLNNIEETNNINFNFYPENLSIRTDIIITLTEGYFKLELELELKDFYSNMTTPLLKLITLLKKNQNDLINIIEKKDLEIKEYILEGGNITQENVKTDTFEKDNFLMNTLQENNDLCNESSNLYEIYTSPLIEQFDNRYPNEFEEFDNKLKVKNDELRKMPSKKKYIPSTSTTMEITPKSINVKKKKVSFQLKNL